MPSPLSNRRGFTLVELLVAVLLIDVGVLAIVAGTTMLARRQIELRTRTAASQLAANRIQRLISGPCVSTVGSAAGDFGATEHWTATVLPPAARDLTDSVAFTIQDVPRSVVMRARTIC